MSNAIMNRAASLAFQALEQEISNLKAKNKELEEQNAEYAKNLQELRTKLVKAKSLLVSDNSELLDSLEETTKIHREIVKGFPITFKDYLPLIESNQALITKYRG